ncbi:hypothetical protein ACFWTE_20300 [Nocardiopsis sp. NPDC058631]|uniref:hypothetical protein n=1 Tax=Nocardiopsis sp. NPDC058631 TaxID=3346566 RepID=UPI00366443C6
MAENSKGGSAGGTRPVDLVRRRLAAMCSYMRRTNLCQDRDEGVAAAVDTTGTEIGDMYRLPALAGYDGRHVVPTAYGAAGADRGAIEDRDRTGGRVNLLNRDGNGRPDGLFPSARNGNGDDTDGGAGGRASAPREGGQA